MSQRRRAEGWKRVCDVTAGECTSKIKDEENEKPAEDASRTLWTKSGLVGGQGAYCGRVCAREREKRP